MADSPVPNGLLADAPGELRQRRRGAGSPKRYRPPPPSTLPDPPRHRQKCHTATAHAGQPERWTAHRPAEGPDRTTRTLDSPQTARGPSRTTRTRTVAEAGRSGGRAAWRVDGAESGMVGSVRCELASRDCGSAVPGSSQRRRATRAQPGKEVLAVPHRREGRTPSRFERSERRHTMVAARDTRGPRPAATKERQNKPSAADRRHKSNTVRVFVWLLPNVCDPGCPRCSVRSCRRCRVCRHGRLS